MCLRFKSTVSAVLLFVSSVVFCQHKITDSIQSALDAHLKQDTVRVNLLNNTAAKIGTVDANQALTLLKASADLATELDYSKGKMECYLQMAKMYSAQKQYETAMRYAKEGAAIAEELHHKKYGREFYLLNSALFYDRYATAKQKRTALREAYKDITLVTRLEKYLYAIGLAALFILSGFVLTLVNIRKVKLQNKQLLTEQKLRRSQMNPHFIFNSLQNLLGLIHDKQEAEAVAYINKFSSLTRKILESSNDNYSSLTEEVAFIENYIDLQQLLYASNFAYTITVDESIHTDLVFLPPMLSQPFIENAIKHGLRNKENGLLKIRFFMQKDRLFFEVIDNGGGFGQSEKDAKHNSMAMEITKQRLAQYTKNEDFRIETSNMVDQHKNVVGAKVAFEIPYIDEA